MKLLKCTEYIIFIFENLLAIQSQDRFISSEDSNRFLRSE